MEEKEITNSELLESINRSFSAIQGRFDSFEFKTEIRFNNLESELRSFKEETRDNFVQVNEKLDDLYDTDRGFDRRISRLEEKVGV